MVIESMSNASTVMGGVLRQSHDSVDLRMRRCLEHQVSATDAAAVLSAMRTTVDQVLDPGSLDGVGFDGPKFCSYPPGGYFRAHNDRSEDPADPGVVRGRQFSVVCLLNDDDPSDQLPAFDGGVLVIHAPLGDGRREPRNIAMRAGSVAVFAADLLHEVRPVRGGIRYSAIGWLFQKTPAHQEPHQG
ncbi:2OG-Fe(II) oxygenase [Frankia sp. CNm7]|uniref:2OG-Fe(II) oxygenase n=1 Tax=Frankia nepalensis TaxID=1836974 RepID=A0A937RAS2_9ACTN|nr:2OG-Fe(II) oxygenase [Frankia nepalensis]MBL7497167.1 2OG-Fe(II) oxygenase [Frankia nepalensis]MBL7513109.1 2OG-Fe(II) oxygenase [Frankia nepalensis]MBL7518324.1 2OG-Fe(II) oxygenase [Frankia nepalensis]MBL7626872.1 2OG-Fe(II) oxygenase [Frankia nepalensis]